MVVLPAPFGPINPTICLCPTRSETSSRARTPPNRTEMFRASRGGAACDIGLRRSTPDDVELVRREPRARIDPPERVDALRRCAELPDHRVLVEDVFEAPRRPAVRAGRSAPRL